MGLMLVLLAFPLISAVAVFCSKNSKVRSYITVISALIIASISVIFAILNFGNQQYYTLENPEILNYLALAISISVGAGVLAYGFKYKKWGVVVLAIIQMVGAVILEFGFAHHIQIVDQLYFDDLTLIMVLIIGVVGSAICVYAIGYMRDYTAHHSEVKDRSSLFIASLFVFLSAMYVIVFSNNLLWLLCGWEVTTFISFLLIGYSKSAEATTNAFRQIFMNMLGGLALLIGVTYLVANLHTASFLDFILIGSSSPELVVVPALCIGFAGLVKAAQMPFHTWLLGAMVAPTPASALLHSSTMVKAGVFVLIKMSPIFAAGGLFSHNFFASLPSIMVIVVGGATFLFCSFVAISQSNAKRVLAYSTIANLGLIVACAGVGTPDAIWAAILLTIFHAVAKSLLFMCVGSTEHKIGSRDIEDMDALFVRLPMLAKFMMVGIMCMFIAPFGMLIAKWGAMVSFVETGQFLLLILVAFGSAATFMFWAKWLGKLSGILQSENCDQQRMALSERASLVFMLVLTAACSIFVPFISIAVNNYIYSLYGLPNNGLEWVNLAIASLASAGVMLIVFTGIGKSKQRQVDVYLSGVSVNNQKREFINSLSNTSTATTRNYYLEGFFGEAKLAPVGSWICICTLGLSALLGIASIFIIL